MLVSVGGSISTGSTPWIDIISSYSEVNVLPGEIRLGESGFYNILSKLYWNIPPSLEDYQCVEKMLVDYGKSIPLPAKIAIYFLVNVPGIPNSIRSYASGYRLRKRGYNKLLPGFTLCSTDMLKKLKTLIDNFNTLDANVRRLRLFSLVDEYLYSLEKLMASNESDRVIIDQLVTPRLLFDVRYGPVISDIMSTLKIIVVRRDPRDQFIDMLLKKKKHYHIMSADEAVRVYVDQYLPRYDQMETMLERCDSSKVLSIWFEDIFFNFESALDKVESFIGLKKRPSDFNNFDFHEGSKKIQMYSSGEFSKEVAFIEDSMRRHLYSY
ncbi:sulfotransferase domain-containing protein [Halomonas sp. LR5S13]|uniref:sulfotransferase domain-containing protein n=1 Tax=Halomonas rhizosphaerae TaxID=3043296 RepID=UPI0024A89E6F|nr:sulfotransferase domain-containing protein [Halomonas rhizosphaerae]MDI5921860.1 sulfotransferase domain-containing protein [Halomonas rhizosphaerae]